MNDIPIEKQTMTLLNSRVIVLFCIPLEFLQGGFSQYIMVDRKRQSFIILAKEIRYAAYFSFFSALYYFITLKKLTIYGRT